MSQNYHDYSALLNFLNIHVLVRLIMNCYNIVWDKKCYKRNEYLYLFILFTNTASSIQIVKLIYSLGLLIYKIEKVVKSEVVWT